MRKNGNSMSDLNSNNKDLQAKLLQLEDRL